MRVVLVLAVLLAPAVVMGCLDVPPGPAKAPGAASAAPSSSSSEPSLASIFQAKDNEGLRFEDLQVGTGPSIQLGDLAKAHYVGRLADGTEFDSSRNRPGVFEFALGKGQVIRGFDRGMVGMKVGGIRKIRIPWKLGYGEAGAPPKIPPKADLVFEVELLDIPVPAAPPPKEKGAPPQGGAGQPRM